VGVKKTHENHLTPPKKGPISSWLESKSDTMSRFGKDRLTSTLTPAAPSPTTVPVTSKETRSRILRELEFLAMAQRMMFEALLSGVTYPKAPPPPHTSQPTCSIPAASTEVPPSTFVIDPRGDVQELDSIDSKEEGEYGSEYESEEEASN
ncbi:unnamed protein product, partial [Ilex paraguariensis]